MDYVSFVDTVRTGMAGLALRAGLALSQRTLPPASPWADREHFVRTTWAELFDTETVPITRAVGMGIGALARPRHLLTTTVSQLPIVGMRGNTVMEEQPLICRQPEAGRSRSTTILWAVDSMYWFGRVWYVVTDRYAPEPGQSIGKPKRVRWVPEWQAEVDADGNLTAENGNPILDSRNVIRVDGPHEGVLNFGADTIRERLAINAAAANASDNPVPSIVLRQVAGEPMDDNQIDTMLARWTTKRRKKNGGAAYLNQSVEAQALGQQVEQLLIEAKKQSDLDLIRIAGGPAWAADVSVEGSNLTYSNSPSRMRELLDTWAQAYMTAWADRFSMDDVLPAGQWCRFSTVAVLQGNFKERMEGYKAAIDAGIYSAEECKQIEAGMALEGI